MLSANGRSTRCCAKVRSAKPAGPAEQPIHGNNRRIACAVGR